MPGGNQRGPLGEGSQTGRGLGYCAGFDEPGSSISQEIPDFGRGLRWGGRGRWVGCGGRVRRNRFNTDFWPGGDKGDLTAPVVVSHQQQLESHKAQAQELDHALQEIRDCLDKF